MEAVNSIFETLGGERVISKLKNYWMILMIIKQLMISIFTAEPVTVPATVENSALSTVDSVYRGEKESNSFSPVQFLFTLAKLERNK